MLPTQGLHDEITRKDTELQSLLLHTQVRYVCPLFLLIPWIFVLVTTLKSPSLSLSLSLSQSLEEELQKREQDCTEMEACISEVWTT